MSIATITGASAYRVIAEQHNKIGLTLPAALSRDIGKDQAANDRLREYLLDRGTLIDAVHAALTDDRDPALDPTVQQQIARAVLGQLHIGEGLSERSDAARAKLLAKHADALIKQWAGVTEQAGAIITEAQAKIPGVSLRDPQAVTGLRPAHMAVWGQAREAVDHLDAIARAWATLVVSTQLATVAHEHKPLILAELDAHQLAAVNRREKELHELSGVTISLATTETFAQRIKAVKRQREEIARREEARQRDARRRDTATPFDGPILTA